MAAVITRIDVHDNPLVVVDGIHQLAGRLGIVLAAAPFQRLRFDCQVRVAVLVKQDFFQLLNHFPAGSFAARLRQLLAQQIVFHVVITQIGAGDHA